MATSTRQSDDVHDNALEDPSDPSDLWDDFYEEGEIIPFYTPRLSQAKVEQIVTKAIDLEASIQTAVREVEHEGLLPPSTPAPPWTASLPLSPSSTRNPVKKPSHDEPHPASISNADGDAHLSDHTSRSDAGPAAQRPDATALEHPPLQPLPPDQRRRLRPPTSVTDLISPAWCELQTEYTLTATVRGKREKTDAMKEGNKVHQVLEDEVHQTVAIDAAAFTQEDHFGLQLVNVIMGLKCLYETGVTRELAVWGVIDGRLIAGVIDEVTYSCPDPEHENSNTTPAGSPIKKRGQPHKNSTRIFPEERQRSLDGFLAKSAQGLRKAEIDRQRGLPRTAYIVDHKTRGSPSVPGYRWQSELQLMIYWKMLWDIAMRSTKLEDIVSRMGRRKRRGARKLRGSANIAVEGDEPQDLERSGEELEPLAQGQRSPREGLDTKRMLSDSFRAQMMVIHAEADHQASSQSAENVHPFHLSLPEEATLQTLWDILLTTTDQALYLQLPASESSPDSPPSHPDPIAGLSPLLTLRYISSSKSTLIGSKSFLYDRKKLEQYLEESKGWWEGRRSAKGVSEEDVWKCKSCDFREGCDWLAKKREEAVEKFRAKRMSRGGGGRGGGARTKAVRS